jgi:hypothetical protein
MLNVTVLSQLLLYLPRNIIASKSSKYSGDSARGHFDTKTHLIVLFIAQIKNWESLREIETGFLTKENNLYHLGIKKLPKRSTISEANLRRDCKIFEEIFYELLSITQQKLNRYNKLLIKKDVNLFDSTIITLSLELFTWAKYREQGGFKIHTIFNIQSNSPVFANITHGNVNDIEGIPIEELEKLSNTIVVCDRGYVSFSLFQKMDTLNINFVTRIKKNIKYKVIEDKIINKSGVLKDQIIFCDGDKVKRVYKKNIRLILYKDKETGKEFKFITNNFGYSPKTIAYLYKKRWEIELFFKWLKQHLIIKKYLGYSENAVKIQVWVSLITYLLLLYVKESINFNGGMLEFTRLTREVLFDTIGLLDLKNKKFKSPRKKTDDEDYAVELF